MTTWLTSPPPARKAGRPRSPLRDELKAHPGKWREVKVTEGRHLVKEGYERVMRKNAAGEPVAYMRWPKSAPLVLEAAAHCEAQAADF